MPTKEIEFHLPSNKRDKIVVKYDPTVKKEILGMATDGDTKNGHYFPVTVKHRAFELKLLMLHWDDGLRDIHPQFISGGDHFQTLHGRLRMSISPIRSGRHRSKYTLTLKKALLKRGITPHANLFGSTFSELNSYARFDAQQCLLDFGAADVGSKEEVLGTEGPSRTQNCVIFSGKNYEVPIAAFVLTRVMPILRKAYN